MTSDLFGFDERARREPLEPARADAPLADRMRPRSLEEFLGQRALVGPGGFVARALEQGLSQSLILWGPPGSGKTTLARLIAARTGARFVPFSAVLSGIKEVKQVMAEAAEELARKGQRSLLFVDEIHRFNKAQQDAFLPYLERGDILLIGATTENPSFELNSALLSRARVLILEPLSPEDLALLLTRALADPERGLRGRVGASGEMLARIAHFSDGDARRALNLLESAAALAADAEGGGVIDAPVLERAQQQKVLAHDKAGEQHYDLASALHKSVRNSDENAALYWLVRALEAGEDRSFVARRLVRMAIEDIGLADPFALRVALDAAEAWERLGTPEGELALAQAAVYLARARKSNAVAVAYDAARADVEGTAAEPVPLHLRNAATALMRAAGYGRGYRYAHDDPRAKDEMTCLPPELLDRRYFPARSAGGDGGPARERSERKELPSGDSG